MAVAFDAKPTAWNSADGLNQQASAATSISASTGFTVGASATLLLVFLNWQRVGDVSGVSVTWNGTAMTLAASVGSVHGATMRSSIYYMTNPTTGTKTLSASWTGSCDCYMGAASFTGADIQTADNNTATDTTSITVTSTTDGATAATFTVDGSTPTLNQTKIYAEAPLNPGGAATYAIGGTSNSHTFTGAGGSGQALVGVHLVARAAAASGGSSGNIRPMAIKGLTMMSRYPLARSWGSGGGAGVSYGNRRRRVIIGDA